MTRALAVILLATACSHAPPPRSDSTIAPMPTTSKPKTVPPYVFDREVRERPMPHLSDSTRAELVTKYPGITNVVAMYTVTVGTDGAVVSVDPIEPNAIVDAAVVPTLRRWRFRPQAVPIRSMLRFVLMVQ